MILLSFIYLKILICIIMKLSWIWYIYIYSAIYDFQKKMFVILKIYFNSQALQGYKEGLEDSALVLLQTFLGFATALGCVGFGLVIVRPSSQCLISRQYLAQAAMLGIGKIITTNLNLY